MLPRPFVLFVLTFAFASIVSPDTSRGFDDWPQWRGPHRDGISTDTGLLKEWPKEGPSVLWQVDTVGAGYSSLAIQDGRIYTQGDLEGVEQVLCLDAKTGDVIWAIQPEPSRLQLAERVAKEMENLDRNQDGRIDEVEALSRLGFEFNTFDRKTDGDPEALAGVRTERLFALLDTNQDQRLSAEEAGRPFYNEIERIDRSDESVDAKELAAKRTTDWIASCDKNSDGQHDLACESGDRFRGRAAWLGLQ